MSHSFSGNSTSSSTRGHQIYEKLLVRCIVLILVGLLISIEANSQTAEFTQGASSTNTTQ